MNDEYKHSDITEKIIGSAFEVHRALGSGFLEKVYENALALELCQLGLRVEQQKQIAVSYKGHTVGEFAADLVVEACTIVELKAVKTLDPVHEAQLVNYLKATGIEVGLLLNFGHRVEVKRRVFG